jgi:2-iminobutanoate/2-iminopropanoate deaminase
MQRRIIATDRAPAAIGPYSQAVVCGDLVFTAGQIPIDPASGEFVRGGIAAQTEQVLKNLSAVLEAAGSSLANVVKVTVFLEDMDQFGAMNEVYARFFPVDPPARSAIEASELPKRVGVEMECVAMVG